MNTASLIDAIVRQTTILIAQLATASGGRPSLAHTANQVFANLVRELREQGVGNKLIADMFGMALRTYHDKVKRLGESSTERGRSLWEAVSAYVEAQGTVTQLDVLSRFKHDDPLIVRGILNDLVDSGALFRTRQGSRTVFRVVNVADLPVTNDAKGLSSLVWVAVNRLGRATTEQLIALIPMDPAELASALEELLGDGRVTAEERLGCMTYTTDGCFIPVGDEQGFEAAIFDHYQAVVTAICTKLRRGRGAGLDDTVGGATHSYVVWPEHPMLEEVLGSLREMRARCAELRRRVATYNESQVIPEQDTIRVVTYVGQTTISSDPIEGNP
jgi:hypothetical protein